jgi:hypothetical protein
MQKFLADYSVILLSGFGPDRIRASTQRLPASSTAGVGGLFARLVHHGIVVRPDMHFILLRLGETREGKRVKDFLSLLVLGRFFLLLVATIVIAWQLGEVCPASAFVPSIPTVLSRLFSPVALFWIFNGAEGVRK